MFAKSGMKERNSKASGKKKFSQEYDTAAQISIHADMCFMEHG